MSADAPRSVHPPTRQAGQLRTVTIVIYATLLLLALAIPESVVNWIRDIKSIEVQEALLPAAEAFQRLAQETRIAAPYSRARAAFLALTSKENNN